MNEFLLEDIYFYKVTSDALVVTNSSDDKIILAWHKIIDVEPYIDREQYKTCDLEIDYPLTVVLDEQEAVQMGLVSNEEEEI